MSDIGKCTRIALINIQKSQTWLAHELGTSQQQVNRICSNQDQKHSMVERLSKIFQMSYAEFTSLSELVSQSSDGA